MNSQLIRFLSLVMLVCISGCAQHAEVTTDETKDIPPVTAFIEEEAEVILRQMSDFLAEAEQFSLRSRQLVDEVSESGQRVLLFRSGRLMLQRPDRFRGEFAGDLFSHLVIHDGESITLFDRRENVYAKSPARMASDEAVDRFAERYGLVLPLADIVAQSPYGSLVMEGTSGEYVGLHEVEGVRCHHLAFSTQSVDWQIWIPEVGDPVPRLLVITYKEIAGHPQFLSYLDNWDFTPGFSEDTFSFVAPSGAEEIEFYEDLMEEYSPGIGGQ